jgi:hypothetical protein
MTDLHVDADGKEYFTDKDGRKWERRKIVPIPGIPWIWVDDAKPDDRWVLERPVPPEPVMDLYWRAEDVIAYTKNWAVVTTVPFEEHFTNCGTSCHLLHPRRLPREEKP